MHRLMIFLTIFIQVVSTKTTNLVMEPAQSELKLFANNYRILSRVTNAIHLQSVLAQKNFKVDDVLSEFLEIKPEDERFTTKLFVVYSVDNEEEE